MIRKLVRNKIVDMIHQDNRAYGSGYIDRFPTVNHFRNYIKCLSKIKVGSIVEVRHSKSKSFDYAIKPEQTALNVKVVGYSNVKDYLLLGGENTTANGMWTQETIRAELSEAVDNLWRYRYFWWITGYCGDGMIFKLVSKA